MTETVLTDSHHRFCSDESPHNEHGWCGGVYWCLGVPGDLPEVDPARFARYNNGDPNPAFHEHMAAGLLGASSDHTNELGQLYAIQAQAHATLAVALRTKAQAAS